MQDPKRTGHRGFGFVTFGEDGVSERVSRRSHEICGQQVLDGVNSHFFCLLTYGSFFIHPCQTSFLHENEGKYDAFL